MASPNGSLDDVIARTRALLEEEAAMGGIGVPVMKAPPLAQAPTALIPVVAPVVAAVVSLGGAGVLAPEERKQRLQVLATDAAACTRCQLHSGRSKSVFSRGSQNAEIVFVGEGPGRDEDAQGLPFVGAAGQLLDKMIAAMGYGRDDVYICNVVKCRPPENRTPLPNEAAACEPYLTAQLEIVAPKVIVALGKCAAINLGVAGESGRWRGIWKQWRDVPVMPTYHPAFLLRSPERKRDVWEDLQLVMQKLGRPVKSRT